ncbi:MAG: hypothetical protein QXL77_07570 [Candidatus Bathyarchaeia archaeon]
MNLNKIGANARHLRTPLSKKLGIILKIGKREEQLKQARLKEQPFTILNDNLKKALREAEASKTLAIEYTLKFQNR